MNKLKTKICWTLTHHCKSECSYCPSRFRHGEEPKHISKYNEIAKLLIDHFEKQNRIIDWSFNGGELLDIFDFPEFLKICKNFQNEIELTTNGGKIWLDWWAIEPYIDKLNLSYHYWQNPNLIKFIIQTFQKNNKSINVIVPLRPGDDFDYDLNRAFDIENAFNIIVNKSPLFKEASQDFGYLKYTNSQFEIMFGKEWVKNNTNIETKTFEDYQIEKINVSPSFTGKLCNIGIEKLTIDPGGWVAGGSCNNLHLGNIWKDNFFLPDRPSCCKMIACTDKNDQQITKFD